MRLIDVMRVVVARSDGACAQVGALRGRPRNSRAEALAAGAGLAGLSIHGDVYVGRTLPRGGGGAAVGALNVDFSLGEMSPDAGWAVEARRAHGAAAAAAGHGDSEHLRGGSDAGGTYAWTQTEEEVEVREDGWIGLRAFVCDICILCVCVETHLGSC